MNTVETFYRRKELGHEPKVLSATTYNAMRLLFDYRSEGNCVFVPIRSMQYMAVIDDDEVIFIDSITARSTIEFAWQKFQVKERSSLTDPVPYRFVYYDKKAFEVITRIQAEFDHFINQQAQRIKDSQPQVEADIIDLKNRQ